MFSKHPLDLSRKLDRARLADALRMAIAAELDAISLYLQLAEAAEDEVARRVFRDVAREEKTHVGEFLELLKRVDPEQAEELVRGAREVEELGAAEGRAAGSSGNSPDGGLGGGGQDEWLERKVRDAVREEVARSRTLLKMRPRLDVGPGVDVVAVQQVSEGSSGALSARERLVELQELSVEFLVPQRAVERGRRLGLEPDLTPARAAARRLVAAEESAILGQLSRQAGLRVAAKEWGEPGRPAEIVAEAVSEMERRGVAGPYLLIVPDTMYVALLRYSERAGVMELDRVERVARVVRHPAAPRDAAILVALDPASLDVAVGVDAEVVYLGPEAGGHRFRVYETLALRLANPAAVALLEKR